MFGKLTAPTTARWGYAYFCNSPNGYGELKLEQTGCKHTVNGVTFTARKKTGNKWFETQDQIGYWDDFSKQKIVWADLTRISKSRPDDFPRFSFAIEEIFLTNTAYFIVGENTEWILEQLNSFWGAYYLLQQVATLDNGGLRMFSQYVEKFPIPPLGKNYGFTINEIQHIKSYVTGRIAEIMEN